MNKKKTKSKRDKTRQKIHYPVLIGLMIVGAIYHFFMQPTIIGRDSSYVIYVFLWPMITGMLLLGIYRRRFLADRFKGSQNIALLFLMTVFYLLQGMICAYLCFAQFAGMGWDLLQVRTAKNSSRETFYCEPDAVGTTNRTGYISFTFHGKSETLQTDHQFAKKFEGENIQDYTVAIEVRKGIRNCYLVESWEMQRKYESLHVDPINNQ